MYSTDPSYLTHFLLTYRRFTTPRAILLGMQRRLRFLDSKTSADPLFTSFAQMRLCAFLARWMALYPGDFAATGVDGALRAFVNAVVAKIHLIHYAAVFRPFLERMDGNGSGRAAKPVTGMVSGMVVGTGLSTVTGVLEDEDADWALKVKHAPEESESDESYMGDEDESVLGSTEESPLTPTNAETPRSAVSAKPSVVEEYEVPTLVPSRQRTTSAPLPLTSTHSSSSTPSLPTPLTTTSTTAAPSVPKADSATSEAIIPPKMLTDLLRVSSELQFIPPRELAEELTGISIEYFLAIKSRDWIRSALGLKRGSNPPETDPVVRIETFANHVADWVASLILCHDKVKARAKHMARLVETAQELREMGNYAMLRAFVAGISVAAAEGDASMAEFKRTYYPMWKKLSSFELLLKRSENYKRYRMAVANTTGPCVPALAVHLSELQRTGDGNPDFADDQPELAHWGKFAILGKIVDVLVSCQRQTEATRDRSISPKKRVRDLVRNTAVLTPDVSFIIVTYPLGG
jgi:hypothetical protein